MPSLTRSSQRTQQLILLVGCIGACLKLFGLYQPLEQAPMYYFFGSTLLLITAGYYKLIYFIALEMILISGHGAILFGIGPTLPITVPILLSLQLLIFYYLSDYLTDFFITIGIFGIAFLSIGFAYQDQFIFFGGSSAIAIYAFHASRTTKPALLWGIVNLLFSFYALLKIIL